jgi:3-hydroxybutyryl-CoA dehydrogenase
MGPFALIDLVGVDVTVAILDALHAENPDPYLQPAAHLRRMLAAGQLGRKSGRGFYDYSKR